MASAQRKLSLCDSERSFHHTDAQRFFLCDAPAVMGMHRHICLLRKWFLMRTKNGSRADANTSESEVLVLFCEEEKG